jgi:hypothetical protein
MKTEPVRRRHSVRALTAKVTAICVAAAIAITGGLAVQMAQGHDPALRPKGKAQADRAAQTGVAAAQMPAQVVTRSS